MNAILTLVCIVLLPMARSIPSDTLLVCVCEVNHCAVCFITSNVGWVVRKQTRVA